MSFAETDGEPEIVRTDDGSDTLKHSVFGELYHSSRGAEGESRHVFIGAGFDAVDKAVVRVFEAGFGSGLNALLTLMRARERNVRVEYHTAELYPVGMETVAKMRFPDMEPRDYEDLLAMHRSPWGTATAVNELFTLKKIHGSLTSIELGVIFDVVYFDVFAPDIQPELWNEEVFARMYGALEGGGILVTYSAKGAVKKALRAAGFEVKRMPGALGKRHMLKAVKQTGNDGTDEKHHIQAGDTAGADT